jgi:hypothetical protein
VWKDTQRENFLTEQIWKAVHRVLVGQVKTDKPAIHLGQILNDARHPINVLGSLLQPVFQRIDIWTHLGHLQWFLRRIEHVNIQLNYFDWVSHIFYGQCVHMSLFI